jgi:hypothetical protein
MHYTVKMKMLSPSSTSQTSFNNVSTTNSYYSNWRSSTENRPALVPLIRKEDSDGDNNLINFHSLPEESFAAFWVMRLQS